MKTGTTGRIAAIVLALAAALAWGVASAAEEYPSKPIRLVVPFGPGGVADLVSRTFTPKMAEALGGSIVIENKPSAGGIVAANDVAHSAPDGYTLMLITNGNAVSQALFKHLPYDPVNDFSMISTVGFFSLVLMNDPRARAKSVREVIDLARANPGKLNFGTIGLGSTQNLAAELFKSMAGIDVLIVPYKTTGEVVTAAKNQDVAVVFEFLSPSMAHIKSGNLRALAVTTEKRFPALPDVPAVADSMPGYVVTSWNGLAAPARTPRAIVDRLNSALRKALDAPEVKQRFTQLGVQGGPSSPEELRTFFVAEAKRWGKVVEAAKIPKR